LHNFKNKTIAVIGGSGYIGSSLIETLIDEAKRIICISRKNHVHQIGVDFWQLDLKKRDSWINIISESDIIFYLGGNTSIYDAEKNPEANLFSTLCPIINMIEVAKELSKVPRVIFASTVTVYGLTDILPVSESSKASPISIYDLHKVCAEKHLTMATNNNTIHATSLRLSNVFGPSPSESSLKDRGVVNKLIKIALKGKDLQIYGDGNYLRDYIFIDDVVSAFIQAANSKNTIGKIFNVSSQVGFTIREVIELIANNVSELINQKITIKQSPWPSGMSDIEKRSFIGNSNALYNATKWKPKISLRQGINKTINFYWNQKN
jgi:UDP-glucose 4-epimerase